MRNSKNAEKIQELLRSNYGDLTADFILEAVRYFSNQVAKEKPTNPLRGGNKWLEVAREISVKLGSM